MLHLTWSLWQFISARLLRHIFRRCRLIAWLCWGWGQYVMLVEQLMVLVTMTFFLTEGAWRYLKYLHCGPLWSFIILQRRHIIVPRFAATNSKSKGALSTFPAEAKILPGPEGTLAAGAPLPFTPTTTVWLAFSNDTFCFIPYRHEWPPVL